MKKKFGDLIKHILFGLNGSGKKRRRPRRRPIKRKLRK
jgi:hypothetical protein